MKKETKASLGLAILLSATGTVSAANLDYQAAKTAKELTRNLDETQTKELIELLNDLKAEVSDWETAGPVVEPSRCFTT